MNGLEKMKNINEFYNYLEAEKRYSINTVKSYKRDLTDFSNYLKKENVIEIDELIIKNYLAYLYTNKKSKKTIARRISSIKSYYKYLNKKFNSNYDFLNAIKTPKKDKLLPNLIYREELQKILEYSPSGKFSHRNKAIINLLYSSGIRVSELCNITISSIDLENRYLIVTGKGNKTRVCPFSKNCKILLDNYINVERSTLAKDDCNYLFINKFGKKITSRAIELIINDTSKKLFGSNKLHPHLFRHTYATTLLNNGADLRTVQELLGHNSLMTTQVYTHIAKEQINEAYKVSHPRN